MKEYRRDLFLAFISVVLFSLTLFSSASAEEKILDFGSRVIVHSDSTMTVEENITVTVEGKGIKHGLCRNIPASMQLDVELGPRRYLQMKPFEIYRVPGFEIVSVMRDSRPEPYHLKGKSLFIGDEKVVLAHGEHTYTIKYKADRYINFHTYEDKLEWHIEGYNPGYYKSFPVERSSLTLELPAGTKPQKIFIEGYSNPDDPKKDFRTSVAVTKAGAENILSFTSIPVRRQERGPRIHVSLPKGVVHEPTAGMKFAYFLRDTKHILIGLMIFTCELMILFFYYLIVWLRTGKDPKRGIIMPIYTPPSGLSPAAARYITMKGYDIKCFASALMNLAARGYLRISEKSGRYFLTRMKISGSGLPDEEAGLFLSFFDSAWGLDMSQLNQAIINRATGELKNSLQRNYLRKYFLSNARYLFPGIVISLLIIGFESFILESRQGFLGLAGLLGYLAVWAPTAFLFVRPAIYFGKYFFHKKKEKSQYFIALMVVIPLLCLFAFPSVFIIWTFLGIINIRLISIIVAMTALHAIFHQLLKVPTPLGREMMDKIEGFKMFLAATEKDRMNMMNPPEKTPELLQKYMPYALALNVGQKWSEQFSGIMSAETLLAAQGPDPYFLDSPKNVFAEIKSDFKRFP
jgi:hypothetical protein